MSSRDTAQLNSTGNQSSIEPGGKGPWSWPTRGDAWTFGLLCLGLAVLYVPTFWKLAQTVWATDEQGHGPIILAVVAWLAWTQRHDFVVSPTAPCPRPGTVMFVIGLVLFVLGRAQSVLMFEAGSLLLILAGLVLIFKGKAGLRLMAFPLLFLLFMVPLPASLVAAVTTPLKTAVSYVATGLLHLMGYPVGRAGVILTVGPYQLLVADACAGLNSMFTLEALGLLYLKLMRYKSVARNILMGLVVVPIAFAANVIRVIVLILITYHLGDEAGQGFAHGFAGMVLFMVALTLILTVDHGINLLQRLRTARQHASPT